MLPQGEAEQVDWGTEGHASPHAQDACAYNAFTAPDANDEHGNSSTVAVAAFCILALASFHTQKSWR